MNILSRVYRGSQWHTVFNHSDEGGRARSDLLLANSLNSISCGFTDGVFYTGFLLSYGFNIINISILTVIPYVASLFSLLSPKVMARFQERRTVLMVLRTLVYVIKILGITLLPQLVRTEAGRTLGLASITFVYSAIYSLCVPGYSAWHMHYISPEVRAPYLVVTNIVNALCIHLIPLLASQLIDGLQGQARTNAFVVLRMVGFVAALINVYYCQKPQEPIYVETGSHHSLLDVFRIPLRNSRFLLMMLIYGFYAAAINVCNSVLNTWLLETVHTSYLYINATNCLIVPIGILTQQMWSKIIQRKKTFWLLTLALLLQIPTHIMIALVNHENYLWLMSTARVIQLILWMAFVLSTGNLIYLCLPEENQTCYLSFYNTLSNLTIFGGMMIGTLVVVQMGKSSIQLFGLSFGSVPVASLLQAGLLLLLVVLILAIRKKVDTGQQT